jgi:hypothetical protein
MNAYSLELSKKIVEAKERGVPPVEVARTFGVGLSSVKRYAATGSWCAVHLRFAGGPVESG